MHTSIKNHLQTKGIQVNESEKPVVEDILERYLEVPLHAVFLYTTQDIGIQEYILKNWQALDSLSGNYCDIYYSVAQANDSENGYDNMDKLAMIKQAGFDDYTQLPGLFFWDAQGATAYIPFGADREWETITYIIRLIFREIKREASIAFIIRAKQLLE